MPDLPGSTFEKDTAMFKYIVESEDIRVDQMKIYPHAVVPWTVTKKWLESGEYVPYTTQQLVNLLVAFKVHHSLLISFSLFISFISFCLFLSLF